MLYSNWRSPQLCLYRKGVHRTLYTSLPCSLILSSPLCTFRGYICRDIPPYHLATPIPSRPIFFYWTLLLLCWLLFSDLFDYSPRLYLNTLYTPAATSSRSSSSSRLCLLPVLRPEHKSRGWFWFSDRHCHGPCDIEYHTTQQSCAKHNQTQGPGQGHSVDSDGSGI